MEAAEERRDVIEGLAAEGLSRNAMAAHLNDASVPTSRGGAWTATAVKRVLTRLQIEQPRQEVPDIPQQRGRWRSRYEVRHGTRVGPPVSFLRGGLQATPDSTEEIGRGPSGVKRERLRDAL